MNIICAAKILGITIDFGLAELIREPGGRNAVEWAVALRDHTEGGVDAVADLIIQIGPLIGVAVKEKGELLEGLVSLRSPAAAEMALLGVSGTAAEICAELLGTAGYGSEWRAKLEALAAAATAVRRGL